MKTEELKKELSGISNYELLEVVAGRKGLDFENDFANYIDSAVTYSDILWDYISKIISAYYKSQTEGNGGLLENEVRINGKKLELLTIEIQDLVKTSNRNLDKILVDNESEDTNDRH